MLMIRAMSHFKYHSQKISYKKLVTKRLFNYSFQRYNTLLTRAFGSFKLNLNVKINDQYKTNAESTQKELYEKSFQYQSELDKLKFLSKEQQNQLLKANNQIEEKKQDNQKLSDKRKIDSLKTVLLRINFSMKQAFDALQSETNKKRVISQIENKFLAHKKQTRVIQRWIDIITKRKNDLYYAFSMYKYKVSWKIGKKYTLHSALSNASKRYGVVINKSMNTIKTNVEQAKRKHLLDTAKKVFLKGGERISSLLKESINLWKLFVVKKKQAKKSEEIKFTDEEDIIIEPSCTQPSNKITKISNPSEGDAKNPLRKSKLKNNPFEAKRRVSDKTQKQKELIFRRMVTVRSKLNHKLKLIQNIDTDLGPLEDLQNDAYLKLLIFSNLSNKINPYNEKIKEVQSEKEALESRLINLQIRFNGLREAITNNKEELASTVKRQEDIPKLHEIYFRGCQDEDAKIEKLKQSISYLKSSKADWATNGLIHGDRKVVPAKLNFVKSKDSGAKNPQKTRDGFLQIQPMFNESLSAVALPQKERQISLLEFAILSFIIGLSFSWLLGSHLK